jgi:hypothetical protein
MHRIHAHRSGSKASLGGIGLTKSLGSVVRTVEQVPSLIRIGFPATHVCHSVHRFGSVLH